MIFIFLSLEVCFQSMLDIHYIKNNYLKMNHCAQNLRFLKTGML